MKTQDINGRWVVVTGPRELSVEGRQRVERTIATVMAMLPAGIVFGGAKGADTYALRKAWECRGPATTPRLVVIVPGKVEGQPRYAADAIRACADETIEMGLDLGRGDSYQRRNIAMLGEARARDSGPNPVVIGFPYRDQRTGGTRNCLAAAKRVPIFKVIEITL